MSLTAFSLYSTLELVRHDSNAETSERDNVIVASEKVRDLDASQVGWLLQKIGLADSILKQRQRKRQRLFIETLHRKL